MNKLSIFLLGVFFYTSVNAQLSQNSSIQSLDENNTWIKIQNANTQDPDDAIAIVKEYYAIGEDDSFELERVKIDDFGFAHYRYYQTHNSVKVYGAQLLMHFKKDGSIIVNAKLINEISTSGQYQLSEAEALQKAKDFIGADQYYWEIPGMEALIKELEKDVNATYFPSGELFLAGLNRSNEGSEYEVNWKFEIYAKGEKMRTFVFVNAINGEISFTIDGIHTSSSDGVAHTRYHGVQDIITDSTGADNYGFLLKDDTRADGVRTLNMQENTDYDLAVDFTDADNIWDNANDEKDDAAGDTHWGMEMTYDYFLTEHGLDGFNNQGAQTLAYIHYDENYFNAFWNGQFLTFGDGSGNPLTSIDVVGHEFGHGVTEIAAGLEYSYESGALNESFSDIFGNAIEFWALPDSMASWDIGLSNFNFRNMADPNDEGQPDTYLGDLWHTDESDNGGVHYNSGVQNFWFYLLSEGGSGINDNGDAYEVEGLGIDVASKIAYINLNYYLSWNSQYYDAYEGSIQSATDLYGACSEEVRQTIKAWYAVGIGVNELSKDMAIKEVTIPMSSCYLTANESASLMIVYKYIGCDDELPIGSEYSISYSIDNADTISVDLILTEALQSGDTIYYTIDETLDLSEFGNHYINFWVSLEDDLITYNDVVYNQEVTHQVQLASEDIVGFESLTFSPDSFYVETGEHAEAKISTTAENTGSRGFKMTGVDVDPDLLVLPYEEEDNFTANPEFISKACFCVDASDWDNARLAFDMKQYFSEFWDEIYGENMSEYVSAMRLLVNGEQVGEQYHPNTETDDPYLTYYVNLDNYAGTTFEACFESIGFIRNAEDPVSGSNGDNTYLDNVRFADDAALSVNEESNSVFAVYPNPANSTFFIEVNNIQNDYTVSVIDALGRIVFEQGSDNSTNTIEVSLESYVKGIYIVRIQTESELLSKRVILQ